MLQQGEIQLIKSQVRVCSNDKCDCVREGVGGGGGGGGGGGMLNEPGKTQEGKKIDRKNSQQQAMNTKLYSILVQA